MKRIFIVFLALIVISYFNVPEDGELTAPPTGPCAWRQNLAGTGAQ